MEFLKSLNWRHLGLGLLVAMGVSVVLALILILLTYRRLKRIEVPPDADFFTTLRHVPLSLVLILDLLDFGLDFLGAPVGWLILTHLGLGGLRGITVVEGLLPGTQLVPTLTGAWLLAKAGLRLPTDVERLRPPPSKE
ncbi:MAG: hypothetical protein ACP5HM_11380 [Anaerolineae bacterium]